MNNAWSLLTVLILAPALGAQVPRQRVVEDRPVDNTFFSNRIGVLQTVESIRSSELAMSILHVFGPVNGGVDGFWGLDNYANIRLGLDYGLTDDLALGIGRSKLDKTVDVRFKYVWLRQTESGSVPMSVSLVGVAAWDTRKSAPGDPGLVDRMHFVVQPSAARKISDAVSLQLSPTYIRFMNPPPGDHYDVWALGIGARYRYSDTRAVGFEWAPVVSGAPAGTYPYAAVTYEMETGGHVFHIFLSTGDGLNEAYAIARTRNPVLNAGEPVFRFGFNVNRIFRIGGY